MSKTATNGILNILKIDETLTDEELMSNAKFAQCMDENIKAILEERFGLDQSEDFYRGMASTIHLILNAKQDIDSHKEFVDFCYLILYGSSFIAVTKTNYE